MHYEPFGIYAGKTASIEELADGASVAIPNDGSNETRALLLLQDAGLIKLKDGIDPTSDATKLDITENPKNLDIQEIAAEQLPRSLADVDLALLPAAAARRTATRSRLLRRQCRATTSRSTSTRPTRAQL